ncbi:MAG: hypothetical protein CM1200mP30_33980 [Pseudomonadota bacterium]|nr:MAG: hypothetical protein CM1200mP30_33980 [Pseudomonadota bacterium]
MARDLASPAAVVQQYVQQVDDLDSLLRERTRNLMENFQVALPAFLKNFCCSIRDVNWLHKNTELSYCTTV